jgi:UDP-N-acetylmuramoyl-tripeptide--D-alanyl-D-alanine ligase
MEARCLNYIANACGGRLVRGAPETRVRRVCTDSRHLQEGDLFIAIAGERFDGHDFLQDVSDKKAAAVVVDESKTPERELHCGIVAVENTRQALGRLGAAYRADFRLTVIAVAGSNGKTTTKEIIMAVLRERFRTVCNEASFNNAIGVPLTLLKLENAHEAAVLEVGTNHPGELPPLIRMIQPQFGVITSIGREHLEFFGDLDGVAQEEGWLAELLPASGKLFINGDNDWATPISRRTRAKSVRVGLTEGNDWTAQDVEVDESGVAFFVKSPRVEFVGEYRLNLLGRHQVVNALLTIAVAAELGLTREEIRRGLLGCRPAKMRLELWEANGVRVLDDAYNANADSMLAALQTLHDLPCAGRRVAVLGDMAELGEQTSAAHREVGRRAAELRVAKLVTVGKMAHQTAEAARAAGLKEVCEFADVASVSRAVKGLVRAGDMVLLKASRVAGFERVGDALRNKNGKSNQNL